jgi:hypothetical protein
MCLWARAGSLRRRRFGGIGHSSRCLMGRSTHIRTLEATVAVVKRNAILELGFFVVIFTCMILMRFGL